MLLAAALFFSPHYYVVRDEVTASLATDKSGNAYVTSFQPPNHNIGFMPLATGISGFLTKLNPDGKVIYRLELTHNYRDAGSIRVSPDAQGNVYAVVDGSDSFGWDDLDVSAIKLDPAGKLIYKVSLAGSNARAPAIGPDGSTYYTGSALPEQCIPTTPGAWVSTAAAAKNQPNAFAIKINPTGSIEYATFLNNAAPSSGGYAGGGGIAVDSSGAAYIVGATNDPGFPVTDGAFQKQCAGCDNYYFATKLSPDGKALGYSTFVGIRGASAPDSPPRVSFPNGPFQLAVDQSGALEFVTAPVSSSLHDLKLRPDGSALMFDYSVKTGPSIVFAVPDGNGNLFITGYPDKAAFPATEGQIQTGPGIAALIRASDGAILYSTRLPAQTGMVAPDGTGGFVLLAGQSAVTRFIPDTRTRPGLLGLTNVAKTAWTSRIAPGEIVEIDGRAIGPSTAVSATFDAAGRLPFSLGGVQVRFNGIPAPLVSAAAEQVVVQAPYGIAANDTVMVELERDGDLSNQAEYQQGLDAQVILGDSQDSWAFAAALNEDGTVNSQTNPAAVGSVISIFVNGAGAFSPSPSDGVAGSMGQMLTAPVSGFAGDGCYFPKTELLYAGAAGGLAGLAQLNLRVPQQTCPLAPPGNIGALIVQAGDANILTRFWVATSQ